MPNATIEVEPVTITIACETGRHGKCRGQVLSIATGDRPCECPDCHGGRV